MINGGRRAAAPPAPAGRSSSGNSHRSRLRISGCAPRGRECAASGGPVMPPSMRIIFLLCSGFVHRSTAIKSCKRIKPFLQPRQISPYRHPPSHKLRRSKPQCRVDHPAGRALLRSEASSAPNPIRNSSAIRQTPIAIPMNMVSGDAAHGFRKAGCPTGRHNTRRCITC